MRNILNNFHEHSVKFNPRICDGWAKHEIKNNLQYLHDLLNCNKKSFPEGLEYINVVNCTPEKIVEVFTTLYKNDKRYVYDFARFDFSLVQINFEFEKQPIQIYFFMQFTDQHGITYIRDKPFYVKPVLADPLLSITEEGIFLPLNQTPMLTKAVGHFVYKNDILTEVRIHETTIHHTLKKLKKSENKQTQMRITCNAHYLFALEGYRKTFARFKCSPEIGFADKINTTNYPRDEWTIYSSAVASSNNPQMTDDKLVTIKEHNILLAVRNDELSKSAESVIGVFFYVLDFIPEFEDIQHLEDNIYWWHNLGKIIWGNEENAKTIMRKMGNHFETNATYIDEMAREVFRSQDMYIDNLFDYLEWGISNYDNFYNSPDVSPSSIYGKQLMVNRYLLKPLSENLNRCIYKLRSKYNRDNTINYKYVLKQLRTFLPPNLIPKTIYSCSNVTALISSTDSRLFKVGLDVVPQDNVRAVKQKRTSKALQNPKWQFHRSFVDVGCAFALSKHEPIGQDGLNVCANITPTGRLLPQTTVKDVMDEVAERTFIE